MNATRDDNGRWTISGNSEPPSYREALSRHLNALDPIFSRARAACEFEFILSLLRVRGMSDGGWDPYQTTIRAIPKIEAACRQADSETQKHIALWVYGHILEADEPYELLANLVRVAGGGRFHGTCFPSKDGRRPGPGKKIRGLQQMAADHGLTGAFDPLADTWDRNLRNAAFHADYTITKDSLRILDPPTRYAWERFDALINNALAHHAALSTLYQKVHVSSYTESITIPVHPEFSRDPDDRAVVIVREGHGVVGLKDAWTPEQLRQGKVSHRVGRFTANEMHLLESDPTLSVLPAETA